MVPNYLNQQTFKIPPKIGIILLGGAIALILIKLILRVLILVPTGEVGVIENPEKILMEPLSPGFYWLNPLENVVKVSTRTQILKTAIELTSQEGINFTLNVEIEYRINPQKAGNLYQTIGHNEKAILQANLASALGSVTSKYPLKAIYGNQNGEITTKVQSLINQSLNSQGLVIDKVALTTFILPEAIKASLQEQFIAIQQAEKRKIEAKGLADAVKNFQGLITPQNAITVVSDDSTLTMKNHQ